MVVLEAVIKNRFYGKIRFATEEDLLQVIQIERKVQRSPWSLEHFQAELEKSYSQFFVMTSFRTGLEVVGYLVFWVFMQECYLLNIAVDLSYQGLGVGKKMIQKMLFFARREACDKVFLEVRKSNTVALGLYQSFGFRIDSLKKGAYSDGEDSYTLLLMK